MDHGRGEQVGLDLTYLERMIGEVNGYIQLFGGDNFFGQHLDKAGVKDAALLTYLEELGILNGLPANIADEEVKRLHDEFEETRRQLLEHS